MPFMHPDVYPESFEEDEDETPWDKEVSTKPKNSRDNELRRQAREAGCFGLIGGFAFSTVQKRNMGAGEAGHKDGPFICRECHSDAVVRKCVEKEDHFAHHARTSPAIGPGESDLHRQCLAEICDVLKKQFPKGNWGTNREIPAKPSIGVDKVIPDISGRIGEQRLVIEAQVSFLSIPEIIKRSAVYTKRKIPILWLIPLKNDLGDGLFRPRLYERYLHAMYFGRVYYWRPGFGTKVQPVHYDVAERNIPYKEWYDIEANEERHAGGYDKPYKVIKQPLFGAHVDIQSFQLEKRPEFKPWNERKTVPSLLLWKDSLSVWWDKTKEEAFLNYFKEDNLPKGMRRKKTCSQQSIENYLYYGSLDEHVPIG